MHVLPISGENENIYGRFIVIYDMYYTYLNPDTGQVPAKLKIDLYINILFDSRYIYNIYAVKVFFSMNDEHHVGVEIRTAKSMWSKLVDDK